MIDEEGYQLSNTCVYGTSVQGYVCQAYTLAPFLVHSGRGSFTVATSCGGSAVAA